MKALTFVCELHHEFGTNGWRLESQPGFDPLSGMAVAHDVLEHFADSTDSPADEFQALGCALWIRGNGDYWRRTGNLCLPGEHIASDMPDIIRHITDEGMALPDAPIVRMDTKHTELFARYMDQFRMAISRNSDDPEVAEQITEYLESAIGWMRAGFSRARRKYRRHDPYYLAGLFSDIEEQADKALKYAEWGDRLRVVVNLKRLTCNVSLKQPRDGDL